MDAIIIRNHRFTVCRRIDKPIDEYLETLSDGSSKLNIDCFGYVSPGYSMNLMGNRFNTNHLKFRQTDEGITDWDGCRIKLSDYADCYSEFSEAYPLFYSSDSIHRKPFTHQTAFQNGKSLKQIANSMKKSNIEIGNVYFERFPSVKSLEYEVFIQHMPTMLNYWHVQLEVKQKGKKDFLKFPSGNQPKWMKNIFRQSLMKILERDFTASTDEIQVLDDCVICCLYSHCIVSKRNL